MFQRTRNWIGENVRSLFWRLTISSIVLGAGAWSIYEVNRAISAKKIPTQAVKKVRSSPEPEVATVDGDLPSPLAQSDAEPYPVGGSWQGGNEIAQVANNDEAPINPAPRRALLAPPSRAFGAPVPEAAPTDAMPTESVPAETEGNAGLNPYRGARGGGYQVADDAVAGEADVPAEPEVVPTEPLPVESGNAIGDYSRRFQTPLPAASPSADTAAPALSDAPALPAPSARRGSGRFQPPDETISQEPAPLDPGSEQPLNAAPYAATPLPASDALPERMAPRTTLTGSPVGPPTATIEGAGLPGDKQVEGAQNPSLIIEKAAPAEIQVGKPATFEIRVKNAGKSPAHEVTVTDQVPRGTKFVEARPDCQRGGDGVLTWQIDTLRPGEEKILTVQLMPIAEGEIGSVAQVSFLAHAGTRTICTRPVLQVEHTAPKRVLIGETVRLGITLVNSGSGAATGVAIEEDVPEGLSHAAGRELEYEVGTLKPGESKQLELVLVAEKPGLIENTVVARGEGNLVTEHRVAIEVIAPQLQVGVSGPKRRYLDRQATYTVSVANPGTASAREVELVANLPKGMKFVSADGEGQYDPRQHAVFWSLEELPPSKAGNVTLTTVPTEPGEQRLQVEGKAELGLATSGEQIVQVETAAELFFSIANLSNPIEVGSDTSYEIKVVNNGSKAASNVRIAVALPVELRATGGEGPSRHSGDEQKVIFEPLARLNPREEAIFRVTAQGVRDGDARVRVQLSSDEEPTPITKEESTRIYADR